jgi:IS5 family transposase
MAVKQTGQPSFIEALMPKGFGSNAGLDRLAGLVKWYRLEKLLAHLRDEESPGRPGYPVLVLFRALLLQSLYGLSDRELEEALADRLSFRRFAGLSLEDAVPDHTVLNRFRNRLIAEDLLDKLFAELDRQLEKAGVVLKRGTMLDATLIEAVSAPGSDARPSRDPDAAFGGAKGKGGFTFRLQGPCRSRSGLRSDPHADHDARQHQRYGGGGWLDPRRRESGACRCRLRHQSAARPAQGAGQEAAHCAPSQQTPSGASAAAQAL